MFSTYDLLDLLNSRSAPHARSFDLLSTRVIPRLLNGFAFPPALLPSLLATYRVSTSHLVPNFGLLLAMHLGVGRQTLDFGLWALDGR